MKNALVYVYSGLKGADPAIAELATSELARQYALTFVVLNDEPGSGFEECLRRTGCPTFHIRYRGKGDLPTAVFSMFVLLRRLRPAIVHTHLLDANLVGLLAAVAARVPRRIYTRHHGNQNHRLYPHAVYYDRLCNRLATAIVATSESGRRVLTEKESVPPRKIALVNHGFNIDRFRTVDAALVERMKAQYGMTGRYPVIGVFARQVEMKGVRHVLEAFRTIVATHPSAYLVCSNAYPSAYRRELEPLFAALPAGSYVEIESETNVHVLYRTLDVFVHAPVEPAYEGFGMVYVEALISGVPSVFTMSGIAGEFVKDGENALVVDYRNSAQIAAAIETILADPDLANRLRSRGRESVIERFSHEKMVDGLLGVYRA